MNIAKVADLLTKLAVELQTDPIAILGCMTGIEISEEDAGTITRRILNEDTEPF